MRVSSALSSLRGPGSCYSHESRRPCVYAAKLAQPRMGDDPRQSVVDRNLQVHDTPGLYVFSGAVFPTCTGVRIRT